ncbi:MAG: universal stress protein, partial [Planctomycetales bacterium]|nr:universal stress protein [Planctomycetales bacterium]
PCAVWLAQPQHEPQCKVIVAAVDASPHDDAHGKLNRRILEIGCELAKQERSKLLVCYVWSLYGAEMLSHRLPEQEFARLTAHNRKQHLESFEKLLAEFKLHATGPSAHMLEGEPSLEIPALCHREGADLLLCGTVARQGIPGLLIGNTAERIISRVDCSILALTPQS